MYDNIYPLYGKCVVAQSCLTLCDPMDCSPPGSSVYGILQAKILEWVAISFSRGSSRPRDWIWVFHITGRCFTLWATRGALFFLRDPYNANVGTFAFVSEVSRAVFIFVFPFFFLYSVLHHFHHSVFQVTYPLFYFSYSTIDCSSLVFLLFSSPRSLVNISCIVSILFPRTWIVFTIIILNHFSGRLPLSTS